jgi:small subunit ribosomal protein S18
LAAHSEAIAIRSGLTAHAEIPKFVISHGFPPAPTTAARRESPEDQSFMPRKRFGRNRKNRCRFCTPEGCPRPAYVDYKDIGLLKKLCTNQSKMFSRKRSGNCAAFQRAASSAVKRARYMALLPYVGE